MYTIRCIDKYNLGAYMCGWLKRFTAIYIYDEKWLVVWPAKLKLIKSLGAKYKYYVGQFYAFYLGARALWIVILWYIYIYTCICTYIALGMYLIYEFIYLYINGLYMNKNNTYGMYIYNMYMCVCGPSKSWKKLNIQGSRKSSGLTKCFF